MKALGASGRKDWQSPRDTPEHALACDLWGEFTDKLREIRGRGFWTRLFQAVTNE